ncbi:MAG: AsmA family protein [Verrucomicrobia bacterium]|nr:AsmA family protein [Verrucomicrobiota bacterium]
MMRIIKWLIILVTILVLIVAGLVLSKDSIARAAAEQQIRAQTGMDVKIEKFSVGLLSPVVTIQNLKLYNTPEFGGAPFLNVRELHIEFDRAALVERRLKITLLRLDLAELTLVRNGTGATNFQSIASLGASRKPHQTNAIEFAGIDVANISVGRVRSLDLKSPQKNREWNANLRDQVFQNIKTPGDAGGVLVLLWARSGGSW